MGNVFLIPENLAALSQAAITASSEASASMADDNLKSEAPSRFWRSTSNAPSSTHMSFGIKTSTFSVNAVAIVGHNLFRGDQYRINTSYAATGAVGFTAYNPTGNVVAHTSNTTSVYTDFANGETTPGASWAIPTNSAIGWSIGASFGLPAVAPATGVDKQCFWIYAKTTNGSVAKPVTVTVSICESGVVKQTLAPKYLISTTGQWLFFPWNASDLGTASGNDVEIKVYFDVNGTAYGSLGSVIWAEDSDTAMDADSGWITYNPLASTGITYKPEAGEPQRSSVYAFTSTPTPTSVYVHIRSCYSPADYNVTTEILPSPPGYVQVGTLVVGEKWSPAINVSYGKLVGGADSSPRKRTYGGQLFGSRRPVRRVVSLNLGHLTTAECHTLFDRVVWRHGAMKPFLISVLPDDATQSKHTTIFAVLRNPENWVNIQPEEGYENNMQMDFEEVL